MKPFAASIKPELFPQAVIFSACFCLLLGAFLLNLPEDKTAGISFGGFLIPDVCVFKNLTGLPCPGCGLTRSMTAAVHGDFFLSWRFHRLGLVTVAYILLQFMISIVILAVWKWRRRLQRIAGHLNNGLLVLGLLFFVNWAVNLALLI